MLAIVFEVEISPCSTSVETCQENELKGTGGLSGTLGGGLVGNYVCEVVVGGDEGGTVYCTGGGAGGGLV